MNVLAEIYYTDYKRNYQTNKEKGILLSDPIIFTNKEIQDKYIFQYNHIFNKN